MWMDWGWVLHADSLVCRSGSATTGHALEQVISRV